MTEQSQAQQAAEKSNPLRYYAANMLRLKVMSSEIRSFVQAEKSRSPHMPTSYLAMLPKELLIITCKYYDSYRVGSQTRIQKEFVNMRYHSQLKGLYSVNLAGDAADPYLWEVKLRGPEGSPYENGVFTIHFQFPVEYPFKGPKCQFKTSIFHPAINTHGNTSFLFLTYEWSPQMMIESACEQLIQVLAHPSAELVLHIEATELLRSNPEEFRRVAREWTERHATKPSTNAVLVGLMNNLKSEQ